MYSNRHYWYASTYVTAHSSVSIPIHVDQEMSSINGVVAALWWPETSLQQHRKIKLTVCRPTGGCVYDNKDYSVFQRLSWATTTNGTWTVYINNLSDYPQTVYYAFRAYKI